MTYRYLRRPEYTINNLKRFEGFESKVYLDTEGYLTIGYGFKITDLEITEHIGDLILQQKLWVLTEQIRKEPKLNFILNPSKFPPTIESVVIQMCYQMGIKRVLKFKRFLKALKKRDYKTASLEMLDSIWHKQTPARCEELAGIVEDPINWEKYA